jgi:ABC-2 type transport system permease protein/lipopolysaccharide transport system permease protein
MNDVISVPHKSEGTHETGDGRSPATRSSELIAGFSGTRRPSTIVRSDPQSIRSALQEMMEIGVQFDQWATLAWSDVKLRYRRTTLGPLWITLGLGASVFSVGLLYGVLFGNELSQYLPYFAAGIVVWTFLASCITEGCMVFVGSAAMIKAIPVPLVLHVYRMLTRQLIVLAHNLALIVLLWAIYRWKLNWTPVLFLAGLAIDTTCAFGWILTLGIIAARFRDVQLIISTLLQLLFLLTPIMWQPESLRGAGLSFIADANPLYYLVEVFREPLLGIAPKPMTWAISSVFTALSLAVGVRFYARYRRRVAFWV